MTLSSTATKVSYDGDGSTTEFAINFVFWEADDLRVIHRASDGTETVWVRGTHYTVMGGSGASGTLTVKTAPTDFTPAAGESLLIKDSQAETQADSFPLSGAFPSTVVEQRLDKLTRLIQIHSEEIARSILLPETASVSGLTIPEPGAGELVRYNPAGTALETVRAGDLDLGVNTLLTGLATNDFLRWDDAQSAWVNLKPGATGIALLQTPSAPAAHTELGLGTAATKGFLDEDDMSSDSVTAVPSQQSTKAYVNLHAPLRGYIDGLTLSNNSTDSDHDIDIFVGIARDAGDALNMVLSTMLTKQIDGTWAAGNDAGGLADALSVASGTWYHVHLLSSADASTVDAGFDTSNSAANLLADTAVIAAGLTKYRRIGSVLTDGSSNIVLFVQNGNVFEWQEAINDLSLSNSLNTTARLDVLSVPTGIDGILAMMDISGGDTSGWSILVSSPLNSDVAVSQSHSNIGGSAARAGGRFIVPVDASAQVRSRADVTVNDYDIWTTGWIDPRGRQL